MSGLSIDPGKKGAAVFWEKQRPHIIISFYHTPNYASELFLCCTLFQPERIAKEKVNAIRGQGLSSSSVLLRHDERVKTVLDIHGAPYDELIPTQWQRLLGVPHFHEIIDEEKRRAERLKWLKAWALKTYPELAEWDKPKPIPGEFTSKGKPKRETPDIWAAVAIGAAILQSKIN